MSAAEYVIEGMNMSYQREESTAVQVLEFLGKIVVYAIVGVLLFEGMTKGYAFGHEVFCPSAMEASPGRDKYVTMEEGTSAAQAAKILRRSGLIGNEASFLIQAKFYEYTINSGTYCLNTSMTSRDILEVLNAGPETEEEEGS